MLTVRSMEGLGPGAATVGSLVQGQRSLNGEDGTCVAADARNSPAPLHRRPRTDQRLLPAALAAPPLTEMVFGLRESAPPRMNAQTVTSTALELRSCAERGCTGMTVTLRSVQEGGTLAGPNVRGNRRPTAGEA